MLWYKNHNSYNNNINKQHLLNGLFSRTSTEGKIETVTSTANVYYFCLKPFFQVNLNQKIPYSIILIESFFCGLVQ